MSDPDDEKGAPQIVPDAPGGGATERAAANEEADERRAAEHDGDGDGDGDGDSNSDRRPG